MEYVKLLKLLLANSILQDYKFLNSKVKDLRKHLSRPIYVARDVQVTGNIENVYWTQYSRSDRRGVVLLLTPLWWCR